MAKILIIKNDDRSVLSRYEAAEPNQASYGGPWGWADHTTHIAVPAEMDAECVIVQLDEQGQLEVVEDAGLLATKLQSQRESKLSLIRSVRDKKLLGVDIMVNELALAERSDGAAIAAYRAALKGITDDYKEVSGEASAACDDLEADLSDLIWPSEP